MLDGQVPVGAQVHVPDLSAPAWLDPARRFGRPGGWRRSGVPTAPRPRRRWTASVDVGAVGDAHDADEHLVVVDGVDDAVLAASGRPPPLEFQA